MVSLVSYLSCLSHPFSATVLNRANIAGTRVLDSLSSEQVIQCQTEEEYVELYEHLNKMNSRNIAMVFAPNMTQMDDPVAALLYAVQVMNFLKMLIEKTLKGKARLGSRESSHLNQTCKPF
ncbi:hypothetical protein Bca52824_036433 [Brassica carinata]|uniref:Uncharacterized protein n=1 Tax=Brassica carinata TaxID=52824 RepID=A0A8X7V4Z6_BRACI|nr:hypothetical protein Bca52824_036433 [Brassica carinata]